MKKLFRFFTIRKRIKLELKYSIDLEGWLLSELKSAAKDKKMEIALYYDRAHSNQKQISRILQKLLQP